MKCTSFNLSFKKNLLTNLGGLVGFSFFFNWILSPRKTKELGMGQGRFGISVEREQWQNRVSSSL